MKLTSRLGVIALALGLTAAAAPSQAQVFEVIHPDVVEGGFELEILNGASLGGVANGEERSAHEIALGFGITDFWKTVLAIEIANPEGGNGEFEAYEWQNIFLLPFGEGHAHGHDHSDHEAVALEALGILLGFEMPNQGGLDQAAMEVGPIAEIAFGKVETVANLVLEIPFTAGQNPGIAYALQAQYPVARQFGVGFEAFGDWENAFENNAVDKHSIGPAVFASFDLGRGRVLEPKLAALFGLTDNAPDAVISLNFELKF